MSLKKQATKGFIWVAIERFGQLFLQGVLFVILARLLSPEDFGLIAMLTIFFAISQSFIDSGMGQALIREKHISDEDRSTVFWSNMLLSVLFYIILFFSAPFIASFYEQPQLIALTRVMGLSVIFFGVTIVQRSELTQKLNFKAQAYATLPAFVIAGITSVILAFQGFGVWALVAQYLLISAFSSMILWLMQPGKILFIWNRSSHNRLFGFGYKLLLSGLLNTIYTHAYKLVIGKLFAASVLGFYTQAQKMRDIITHGLMNVISKVSYPLLSKAGEDTKRLKNIYQQLIRGSSFIVFPSILLLMILAKPIVLYVLGKQWLPSVAILQIICTHGILYHLHAINLNALKVLGRSDLFLKLEIIKKINITVAIIIGIPFGIYGLLIGQVISSYIALFINSYYTVKFLKYSYIQQGKDILGVLTLSVPMVVFVFTFQWFIGINSLGMLALCGMLAGLCYLITNIAYRTPTSILVFDTISPYLSKRIKKALHI